MDVKKGEKEIDAEKDEHVNWKKRTHLYVHMTVHYFTRELKRKISIISKPTSFHNFTTYFSKHV